ncbi:hypothetical protein L2D08_15325 [Domibacillus sp. PGB-M46]|uniref:hypothetical protein n=1 Tax=Domibacillus sp. PGB-M46 TaxID=2910255 RepID=UPI001F55FFFA|nr:hypothetical protein [Domibacillus sp. PGB-M46]MCI2255742.1 hypothetical protein [Domibacillus sp. PGB-M46]
MKEVTIILHNEVGRLITDYYNCQNPKIRKQVKDDIKLLNEAILLCLEEQPT